MFIRLRDGTERELLEDELIPDGATLLRPLFLRDAALSRPGDALAEEAREEMRSLISTAWRTNSGLRSSTSRAGRGSRLWWAAPAPARARCWARRGRRGRRPAIGCMGRRWPARRPRAW